MGALTNNNRKRGDDCFKSFFSPSPPIGQLRAHIVTKTENPFSPETTRPDSIFSKTHLYPERKSGFPRVHAPVRNSRFGRFSSAKKDETAADSKESLRMGRFSTFQRLYENAKKEAFNSIRLVGKEKERGLINLCDSDEENRDVVTDDSSIEEVKIVDFVGSKRKRDSWDTKDSPEFTVSKKGKEVCSLNSSVVADSSDAVVKVDEGGKAIVMPMDQGEDASGLPQYKRLYNEIKERDSTIARLKFQIEQSERKLQTFKLFAPKKKDEQIKKDVTAECFVALTEDEMSEVSNALSKSNGRKVLVSHESSNLVITGEILQCLRPGAWLNDEAINLYLELLKEREKREPGKFLKCHFFNTFFYKKLFSGRGGYNYQSVRRWTTQRKLGYNLLDCDKIFVPIHKGNHWCLAVINKKDKMFQYLDSLKGNDCHVLDVLSKYFVDEVKDKCGKDIDVSSWVQELVTDLPEQMNGYDCGVFMIKYADFYSRDIGLCFSQDNMPYFRLRTAKEILKLRAE